jgi:hypothetical protein
MKDIGNIIEAAIELENSMSGLYTYLSNRFPDDFNFWEQLRLEEPNHAALLKTIKDLSKVNLFPSGLVTDDLTDYEKTVAYINHSMNVKSIPNRNEAFEFAYSIEKSSGEVHFQETATKKDPDEITRIFIRLNGMDLYHANRILEYQKTLKIK